VKTIVPVATAALLVLGSLANAKPTCGDDHRHHTMVTYTTTMRGQSTRASNPLRRDNPTGLPGYEMRSDGLMLNGLLPANGWEG
jgi:hypothetical protein